MRYISVGCVVGIIAGFCIGPGAPTPSPIEATSRAGLASCTRSAAHVRPVRWITLLPAGGLRNGRRADRREEKGGGAVEEGPKQNKHKRKLHQSLP